MLASPELDQLRQRVLASFHLGPLTQPDTRAYVEHRMSTAGWDGAQSGAGTSPPSSRSIATPAASRAASTGCARALLIYGALEQTGT